MKRIICAFMAICLIFTMTACEPEVKYEKEAQYVVEKQAIAANKPSVERLIAVGNSSTCYYNNEQYSTGAVSYVVEDEVFVPASILDGKFGITLDEQAAQLVCGAVQIPIGADGFVSMKAVATPAYIEYMYNPVKNTGILTKRTYAASVVDEELITQAKATVLEKVKMLDEACVYQFPEAGVNGVYRPNNGPGWVGGFYSGINYRCMNWSDDAVYTDTAAGTTKSLSNMVMANNQMFNHDIGFIVYLSEYQKYMKNPNEESKKVIVNAADGLMARIKPGGYIQAWGVLNPEKKEPNSTRMIIDTMCNLPLLFVATEITGDEKYEQAAITHAKVTQKFIAREDATAAHTYVFNDEGTAGYQQTHQGAKDNSNWSRGLSWYVFGMAAAYEATGDVSFLNSAKEFADTYVLQSEEDLISKWDFIYQSVDSEPYDTSAAAITACGMMNIYELTGDEYYKNTAYYIFESLYRNYSAKDNPESNAVLYHATGNYPQNRNIDVSLIYGDYYFAELIARLCGEKVGY